VLSLVQRNPARKCADQDTNLWFPADEPPASRPYQRARYEDYARALCAGCPVKQACLAGALAIEGRPIGPRQRVRAHGIYGGTAPWEREAMLRASASAAG
jgi:hypothetical protein